MRIVSAAEIDRLLDYRSLIEALRVAFRGGIAVPLRHHHTIRRQAADATFILMPAWHEADGFLGVKIVSVFPENQAKAKPSVMGTYLLLAGDPGERLRDDPAQQRQPVAPAAHRVLHSPLADQRLSEGRFRARERLGVDRGV